MRRLLPAAGCLAAAVTLAVATPPARAADDGSGHVPLTALSATAQRALLSCSGLPATADPAVIRKVYEVGQARNVAPITMLAMFEAGWVESHMNNLGCGQETSVGVFQLQDFWGTYAQRKDVVYSTNWWVNQANKLGVQNYRDAGTLAADVERPREDLRGRYGQAQATAQNLMNQARQPYGEIGKKYAALGGAGGEVGPLVRAEEAAKLGGRFQLFRNGIIIWTAPTGAHWVHGDILTKFWATNSEVAWGFPTMDELAAAAAPDGTTGRYQYFQNALFLWSQPTGTHIVHGEILKAFETNGREAALGYPTSDETDDGAGGRVQQFQNATINWTAAGGAVVTKK
ncbi:LGFP repeat-containing protein [Flexivirga meconopsidis]|uniref:LGFP repeat-containing protein n=1 Tax=Flexivirga meconopsidis TaxID=2977121 RepID=UPI00223EA345|nr:hypothetical protein [Flexivirga meconopsidis]